MTDLKKALEELKKDFSYDKFVDLIVEPKFTDEIKEKMLDVARNMYTGCTKKYINDLFDPDYDEYLDDDDDIDLTTVLVGISEKRFMYYEIFFENIADIKDEEYWKLNREIVEDPFYTDYFIDAQSYFYDWQSCEDNITLDEWKQAFLESAESYDDT